MPYRAIALGFLALALGGSINAASIPCMGLAGSVLDPTGDVAVGDPDIACANVTVYGGNAVVLSVAFAAGAFVPSTTMVTFSLDTDRNPATGHPGVTAGGTVDASILGSEYIVAFGSAYYGPTGDIRKYTGPPINTFTSVGTAGVTYFDDGLQAVLPLPLLGGGSGLMNFKVGSARQITPTGFTGVLDVAPDVGLAAGTSVVIPEPATLALLCIGIAALAWKRWAREA